MYVQENVNINLINVRLKFIFMFLSCLFGYKVVFSIIFRFRQTYNHIDFLYHVSWIIPCWCTVFSTFFALSFRKVSDIHQFYTRSYEISMEDLEYVMSSISSAWTSHGDKFLIAVNALMALWIFQRWPVQMLQIYMQYN